LQEFIQVWQSQVGEEQSEALIESTQRENDVLAKDNSNPTANCDARNVYSKLYQCLYCDKILSSDNQVQSHIQGIHKILKTPVPQTETSIGSSFLYKCLQCNVSFNLKDSIRHWKDFHDRLICKYCQASFKREEELAEHTKNEHSKDQSHKQNVSEQDKPHDKSPLEKEDNNQEAKASSCSRQPVESQNCQNMSNLSSRRLRKRPQRFAETAQLSDCSSVEENKSDSSEDSVSENEETSDSEIDDNETELKPKTATRPENPAVPNKKKKVENNENKGTLISTFRLFCFFYRVTCANPD